MCSETQSAKFGAEMKKREFTQQRTKQKRSYMHQQTWDVAVKVSK